MANPWTINVTNNTRSARDFFLFQQPAEFTGGAQVFSNSLASETLPSQASSGAILTFQVSRQLYAGIQGASDRPQVGQPSGNSSAFRPIDLSPGNCWVTATVDPPRLGQPINGQGIQPGMFRITTPAYQPSTLINVGSAVHVNGELILSSFIEARPYTNVDCRPSGQFYIGVGGNARGTVVAFAPSRSRAALCDFNGGKTAINVVFNADETWTVRAS